MHRLVLVLTFMSFGILTYAFPVDTSEIRLAYERALAFSKQGDWTKAWQLAGQAGQELETVKIPATVLRTQLHNLLGDCALELGRYTASRSHYERSMQLLEADAFGEGLPMAEVFNKLGNYYREIKDFEKALTHFEEALEIRIKLLGNQHLKVADVYNNIGLCKNGIGDFDKALEFHDQSLKIRQGNLPDLHPQIAQSYNNIGICWQNKGEYQLALSNYFKARDQYLQLYGERSLDLADVYLNIGTVYDAPEDFQRFIEYHEKALNIYRQLLDKDHPLIALCYHNMANGYSDHEDFGKAFSLYRAALAIRKNKYGEVHPDVAQTYSNLGRTYYLQGDLEKSIQAYRDCFRALNYQVKEKPTFDEVNNHGTLYQVFYFMTEVQLALYLESGALADLRSAFFYLVQADYLIDFLRTRYEALGSRLELAETAHIIYDFAIELALELYQNTQDEKYREQAFQFSEKSKGILLLEALQKADAETFSGIPAEVIAEVKTIEASVNELEKQRFLEWENDPLNKKKVIDSLSNLIFEQKQLLSSRINSIKKAYPEYYNLRYETSIIAIDSIQQYLLKPGETIIEYFLGGSYLQIFVINKSDFQVLSIRIEEEIQRWLFIFQNSVRRFPTVAPNDLQANLKEYVDAAYYLNQNLIAPVAGLVGKKLVLIPDAELGFLPFDALLSAYPEDMMTPKKFAYLVRDYTISYNYSVTLMQEMLDRKNKKQLKPYLGIAPEFLRENSNGLAALKYNRDEVIGVHERIGGEVIFGRDANKKRFLAMQSGFSVIHLATHGKANNAAGDYSFLAFTEMDSLSGDDALLFVKELYNLSTNAEMVVLSACETGTGELLEGEGIASIARSFSYAGAKSLIATQWSVDDKSTNKLIHLFFERIKEEEPKDVALQAAKLSFIDSGNQKLAHPYFWASFIPIGNMQPVSLQRPIPYLAWGVIPLIIFAFIIYYRRKK